MSLLKPMTLGGDSKTNMSYEDVVAAWGKREPKVPVFTGHFLLRLVSELNQLEGIGVDYNRTRELFENESVSNYTGDVRDLYSVMNNKNVAEYLEAEFANRSPVTVPLILEVHKLIMFGSLDNHRYNENGERAGTFKKHDYCVGRYDIGAIPEETPAMMEELCELCTDESHDPLKVATTFHCFFQNIHLFADGNGRVGRWLLNYFLVLRGHPPVIIDAEVKDEYYKCLEAFDRDEDYGKLYALLRRCTVSSYKAWARS